jgi:hypothetical protein
VSNISEVPDLRRLRFRVADTATEEPVPREALQFEKCRNCLFCDPSKCEVIRSLRQVLDSARMEHDPVTSLTHVTVDCTLTPGTLAAARIADILELCGVRCSYLTETEARKSKISKKVEMLQW